MNPDPIEWALVIFIVVVGAIGVMLAYFMLKVVKWLKEREDQ